jgi:hypothetical protein
VSLLFHNTQARLLAAVHLRTGIRNDTGQIHFHIKQGHFFVDPQLWVVFVLLREDLRIDEWCLVIPSGDMGKVPFNTTLTLDPLNKAFQKYRVPTAEFGEFFMKTAFASKDATQARRSELRKAG